MTTVRQDQHIGTLSAALDVVVAYGVDGLVQKERLGTELSFENGRGMFAEVISTSERLKATSFASVPHGVLGSLLGPVLQIQSLFQQIKAFSPDGHGNAVQARDAFLQQVEDNWNALFSQARLILGPVTGDLARREIDQLREEISRSQEQVNTATNLLQKQREASEEQLTEFIRLERSRVAALLGGSEQELERVLGEVRKAAAEAGVSQHAKYFDDEAAAFGRSSKVWFCFLVLFAVLLACYAIAGGALLDVYGFSPAISGNPYVDSMKLLSQRAILAFLLIFAVVWASRNYSAARHNEVVNRHRRNSLGSFETFAKSASDVQTKNAILIQATQSIFSPQSTGFVKTDGEDGPSTKVLEVFRGGGTDKA